MGNEVDDVTGERAWWKEAVVYQIYPRSFNDSDGDGVGDIPGIIEKADYLADLGIDVVWLSPVYDSPNADYGYDIRDYRSIMDEMGTMADWERLLAEFHDRDIGLVMDLVVNHTSDEHEWFQRSRRKEDGYEDYYHWVEGDPDEPPNNWESAFGGPAWSYDEVREAWYLHLFDEKQPDLNWRNPAVREKIHDVVEFWLEKGVDGFRMDVVNVLSKPEGYPDGDPDVEWVGSEHFIDGPRIHEYLGALYDDVISKYDVMTVGEMPKLDVETAKTYLGEDGMHMAFHFEHTDLDSKPGADDDPADWSLTDLKSTFTTWHEELQGVGWNTIYFGNHDQPRPVTRFGDDEEYHYESATLIATFLLTMPATPFIYQGGELGIPNATFESLEEVEDVAMRGPIERMLDRGDIDDFADVREDVNARSRDHARTPMHWSAAENAGFTDGEPWITVNDRYPEINAADQQDRTDSILAYYRELIAFRQEEATFVYGEYDLLLPDDEEVYAFTRTLGDDRFLVVCNWQAGDRTLDLSEAVGERSGALVVGNYEGGDTDLSSLSLRPYEARVYRL